MQLQNIHPQLCFYQNSCKTISDPYIHHKITSKNYDILYYLLSPFITKHLFKNYKFLSSLHLKKQLLLSMILKTKQLKRFLSLSVYLLFDKIVNFTTFATLNVI